ncbi:hypothetical protein [Edwardsiella piscicida]|nr:hypothetical protein [Edwardsiella piscicida]WGS78863.1 hypothetical protein PED68_03290 [Edwardsiella piscicida]WGS82248.1 hypothetical protein PED70_03295 [Edwardsiella piscicida]WLJ48332.1 hypothetical protein Q8A59_03230 [Edwardsiella piscicida]
MTALCGSAAALTCDASSGALARKSSGSAGWRSCRWRPNARPLPSGSVS